MVYYGVLQSRGTGCKVGNADAAILNWRLKLAAGTRAASE